MRQEPQQTPLKKSSQLKHQHTKIKATLPQSQVSYN